MSAAVSNYGMECCKLLLQYEQTVAQESALTEKTLHGVAKLVENNMALKTRLYEEDAACSLHKSNWDLLSTAAEYATSLATFSIAWSLGFTLPGALLGASATANLINQAVKDSCGWGAFAPYLDTPLAYMSLGLRFAGGWSAITSSAWNFADYSKLSNVALSTASIMKGTSQIVTALLDNKRSALQAEMKSLNLEIEKIEIEARTQVTGLNQMHKAMAAIVQQFSKWIKEIPTPI